MIRLHQVFYDLNQIQHLDQLCCIPYANIPAKQSQYPGFFEYPILKELQKNYTDIGYSGLWGYISWRFNEKVQAAWHETHGEITTKDFVSWINNNPGYNFYHLNVCGESVGGNLIVDGEKYHPGIVSFFQRLVELKQWEFDVTAVMEPKYVITCHYYVMHNKMWSDWLLFLDEIFEFIKTDNFLYSFANGSSVHRDVPWNNWVFIAERLISIWTYINPQVRVLAYA